MTEDLDESFIAMIVDQLNLRDEHGALELSARNLFDAANSDGTRR